jgi:hypothetical protein
MRKIFSTSKSIKSSTKNVAKNMSRIIIAIKLC